MAESTYKTYTPDKPRQQEPLFTSPSMKGNSISLASYDILRNYSGKKKDLETAQSNIITEGEACFTSDGEFDHWGDDKKGPNAKVIIISSKGGTKGYTLKSNASDTGGGPITLRQFLRRAERVYGEGGSNAKVSSYYAHAQDNVRKQNGGGEEACYQNMDYPNFDVSSGFPTYTEWNDARGVGYSDLSMLNTTLKKAKNAIKAVIDLLTGATTDPTNGAVQWRGFELSKCDQKEKEMLKGKTDKKVLTDYGLTNVYVKNFIIMKTESRGHLFFSFSSEPSYDIDPIEQDQNCTDH